MFVRRLALLGVLLFASACARPLVVRAPVLHPARVPLRAFPTIWIAGMSLPEGDLAERLRAHLAQRAGWAVRKVEVQELEPLREASGISPLTLVVTLEPEIDVEERELWDSVPVSYCGWGGCVTDWQMAYVERREVVADLLLTVYEGPSARVLQAERFQVVVHGGSGKGERQQAFEQLALELTRAVDVLSVAQRFVLEPVKEPASAEQALELLRAGKWREGRALLEQAARELGGLGPRVQASVLYDLAIARWAAPGEQGLTEQAYADALRPLERAIGLADSQLYQRARQQLKEARERHAVLEAQRASAAHNFALRAR